MKDEISCCQFCNRLCMSKNGLRSHQNTCYANPNRIKGKRGNGWPNTDKVAFSRKISEMHKTRSRSVNEKIRETINRKITNGEWHNGSGRSRRCCRNGVKFDSSWELKLAEHWDNRGIPWQRNKNTFPYYWNGSVHRYTPDFYLPSSDEYVEVKGYETDRDRAKWGEFPYKLAIYNAKRLKKEKIIN